MTTKRIGFAGLGLMGSRMARQFLDKGFPLAVWNRSAERCVPLREAGAKVAATPRELAEMCDVMVTCVADPNAVGRIVFAEDVRGPNGATNCRQSLVSASPRSRCSWRMKPINWMM